MQASSYYTKQTFGQTTSFFGMPYSYVLSFLTSRPIQKYGFFFRSITPTKVSPSIKPLISCRMRKERRQPIYLTTLDTHNGTRKIMGNNTAHQRIKRSAGIAMTPSYLTFTQTLVHASLILNWYPRKIQVSCA